MDDVLTNFLDITGATDVQARQILEATGHDLQQAIELFFAGGVGVGAGDTSNDAQLAQQLASEGAAGGGGDPNNPAIPPDVLGDDNVRAADPARRERLVAATPHHLSTAHPAQPNEDEQAMNAFRDFRTESQVGDMYAPPSDIMFAGTWESAKEQAQQNGAWLLVNLQDAREFASHQLNRDTWSNETLKSVLQGAFVFFQKVNTTPEGQMLQGSYHILESEFPCTFVVDPMTGQKLQSWMGFVGAERLVEELLPYLDTPPQRAGASFIKSVLKRKHGSGGSTPQRAAAPPPPADALTEDEMIARAISASLEAAPSGSGAAAAAGSPMRDAPEDDEDAMLQAAMTASLAEEAPAAAADDPEPAEAGPDLLQEALDGLPPEPAADDAGACRVALRMPDGTRSTRRFRKSEPVASLFFYCITQQADAGTGRPFTLAAAMPGAEPLHDRSATLEAAGVANSMLIMKWAD